jgi:hypothetical protein
VRTHPGYGWIFKRSDTSAVKMTDEERFANGPQLEMLLRVIALSHAVGESDPKLASDIRSWLVDRLVDIENAHNLQKAARLPQGSLRRRADLAYGAWLASNVGALTDPQKERVIRAVFSGRVPCRSFDASCQEDRLVYPGVDPFAFGLSFVDEWIRAGRPTTGTGSRFEVLDQVVCPYALDSRGKRTRNRSCSATFYRDAALFDRERLVQAIVARNDEEWIAQIVANLEYASGENVVAIWRGLESSPAAWRAMARALLDQPKMHVDALEREAYRLWKDAPAKRGVAIAFLARPKQGVDRHYADEFWSDFARRNGAAGDAELRAMLDLDARTITFVPNAWKGLSPGGWRAQALGPALTAWAPSARRLDDAEPGRTARALHERVCADRNPQELAQLQATFRSLASHDASFGNLSAATCGR